MVKASGYAGWVRGAGPHPRPFSHGERGVALTPGPSPLVGEGSLDLDKEAFDAIAP